jgi:VanZ family protein
VSAPATGVRPATRRVFGGLAVLALLLQLVVLYAPSAPGEPLFPGDDKVVHVVVFAVPVLLLLLAGAPARGVVVVLALHAVASEVVQGALLPDRSADPLDVVADLLGVAVGWGLWRLARRGGTSGRW